MKIVRATALYLAALAALSATMVLSAPVGNRAEAAICPFVVFQACVKEKDGFVHTEATNACFAKERGAKILYRGACKGK